MSNSIQNHIRKIKPKPKVGPGTPPGGTGGGEGCIPIR